MPDARPSFEGCSGRSGAREAGEREQPSAGAGDLYPHAGRSIYQTLSRVTSGGGAASRLAVAGLIPGKDVCRFEAFSGSWPPSSTFDKLLYIERRAYTGITRHRERAATVRLKALWGMVGTLGTLNHP